MKTPKICLLLFPLLFLVSANLPARLTNEQSFGANCLVLSYIDDATNLKSSILSCYKSNKNVSEGFLQLSCDNKNVTVIFDAGLNSRGAKMAEVVFRFDKGQGFSGTWNYDGRGGVITVNHKNHKIFLTGLSGASKLEYDIGGQKGDLDLDGISEASSEYIKRCADLNIKVNWVVPSSIGFKKSLTLNLDQYLASHYSDG